MSVRTSDPTIYDLLEIQIFRSDDGVQAFVVQYMKAFEQRGWEMELRDVSQKVSVNFGSHPGNRGGNFTSSEIMFHIVGIVNNVL